MDASSIGNSIRIFFNDAVNFINSKWNSLTQDQKSVATIAGAAFAALSTAYMLYRLCIKKAPNLQKDVPNKEQANLVNEQAKDKLKTDASKQEGQKNKAENDLSLNTDDKPKGGDLNSKIDKALEKAFENTPEKSKPEPQVVVDVPPAPPAANNNEKPSAKKTDPETNDQNKEKGTDKTSENAKPEPQAVVDVPPAPPAANNNEKPSAKKADPETNDQNKEKGTDKTSENAKPEPQAGVEVPPAVNSNDKSGAKKADLETDDQNQEKPADTSPEKPAPAEAVEPNKKPEPKPAAGDQPQADEAPAMEEVDSTENNTDEVPTPAKNTLKPKLNKAKAKPQTAPAALSTDETPNKTPKKMLYKPNDKFQDGTYKAIIDFKEMQLPGQTSQIKYKISISGTFKDGVLIQATEIKFLSKRGNNYTYTTGLFTSYLKGKVSGTGSKLVNAHKIEEGTFLNGLLNGQGKRFKDGKIIEAGTFKAGILTDGCRGDFARELLNGSGERIQAGKIIEKGSFLEGKLSGKGIRNMIDDADVMLMEEGEFLDGVLITGRKRNKTLAFDMFANGKLVPSKSANQK